MQITTRAAVLAVALLASAPLLAANSCTSSAGTDASTQETQMTTEDDCWLSTLPSTDLSANLLPKPGSTPPDTAELDRRLSKWNDDPEDSASSKWGYSVTAMPPGSNTAWPWQRSFPEGSRGADGLSVIPVKTGSHF
jgi:hypothetical protein